VRKKNFAKTLAVLPGTGSQAIRMGFSLYRIKFVPQGFTVLYRGWLRSVQHSMTTLGNKKHEGIELYRNKKVLIVSYHEENCCERCKQI